MTSIKYDIDHQVWRATFSSTDSSITCPDCGGEGRIRCILYDNTEVSVECEGCKRGFDSATGRVKAYIRKPYTELVRITGFGVNEAGVEYRINGCWIVKEDSLFGTEQEAMAAAIALVDKEARQDLERINRKEKPNKTWAWNAHYHRRGIREAERQIAYHTARLNVAKVKAKEPLEVK